MKIKFKKTLPFKGDVNNESNHLRPHNIAQRIEGESARCAHKGFMD